MLATERRAFFRECAAFRVLWGWAGVHSPQAWYNKQQTEREKKMKEQLIQMASEADAKSAKAVERMSRARKRGHVLAFHNAKIDFRHAVAVVAAINALIDIM